MFIRKYTKKLLHYMGEKRIRFKRQDK